MQPESRLLRVLVVDDDPAVRELLSTVVISGGYGKPTLAGDGAAALAAAPEADLILLDHLLPDAAGIDLLPALRALPHKPSVILVTAHGSEALGYFRDNFGLERNNRLNFLSRVTVITHHDRQSVIEERHDREGCIVAPLA